MKRALLFLLTCCLAPLLAVGGAPQSGVRFESGVSGLGYRWDFCRDGDVVRYAVFAFGPRPREMGEEKPGQWVSVSGASSRTPKATLRLRSKKQRDLLAATDLIYQIDRDGQVSTYDERVTTAELNAFMGSYPQQYTAQALLDYVRQLRSASR